MVIQRTSCLTKFDNALELLSERLYSAASSLNEADIERIIELRLRKGRCFTAVIHGDELYISKYGSLERDHENALTVEDSDIAYTFRTAFKGSVHAFPRELAEGFITCGGGNRVGFCGSAVLNKERTIDIVKNISSVNIRIAREIKDCSADIFEKAFENSLSSLIIASPPCGGKTTILRDLCRRLGDKHRVAVIDERGEIAAVRNGVPQNEIGEHTDVFDGYPKAEGIITAIRVMSPEIIICDEIGSESDRKALSFAANSGVKLVCSCHSPSLKDLKKRPAAGRLIREGFFDCAAVLGTGRLCGRLTAFYDLNAERGK